MVEIYTDGACKGNPGKGGWGVYIKEDSGNVELYGGAPNTTNNKMELMAVFQALSYFKKPTDMTIYIDSQYVQKGMTEWIHGWKKRGWISSTGEPVKNKNLWVGIDELAKQHTIQWKWVKGHASNEGNNKADALANKGVYSV